MIKLTWLNIKSKPKNLFKINIEGDTLTKQSNM